jgi:hypothetical protein
VFVCDEYNSDDVNKINLINDNVNDEKINVKETIVEK